ADVGGERLQRRDVDGVEAGAGRGTELDQARQEAGKGLAAAGRGDEQGRRVARPLDQGELVGVRRPAPPGEPAGEGLGQQWDGGVARHGAAEGGGDASPDQAAGAERGRGKTWATPDFTRARI